MKKTEAKFDQFDNSSNWVNGSYGDFRFEAKLFDVGSEFGINNGRVSKLYIQDKERNSICEYDRGWGMEPKNKTVYNSIMKLLEESPARFKDDGEDYINEY